MLSFISKKYNTPIVYVNQVGAIDEICCDGASRVYNKFGQLNALAKSFEEQFFVVNPFADKNKINPLTCILNEIADHEITQKYFSLNYEYDLERTYKNITLGIKDYFNKRGLEKALLFLTNRLDKAVLATLLSDGIGPSNVLGLLYPLKPLKMPIDIDSIKLLVKNLGINYIELPSQKPIEDTIYNEINECFKSLDQCWGENKKSNDFKDKETIINAIDERFKFLYLSIIAKKFPNTLPVFGLNKTDTYVGGQYLFESVGGGFAPLGDLPKTKVIALAKWINDNRIPQNIIPTLFIDEPENIVEGSIPDEFLDEIIWYIENLYITYNQMLHHTFEYEKACGNLTFEQKKEWIGNFLIKMESRKTRWWDMPPIIINEEHSVAQSSYSQPLSSVVHWKTKSIEEIKDILDSL